MSKQKKGFVLCMVAAAVMLVVSLLLPTTPKTETVQEAMRDAVLHESNRIDLFGKEVNPGLISAMTVSGILLVVAACLRIFVIPRFQYVPGRLQLLLEELVGLFDRMAKSNSPERNGFLGAYIFGAGVYIFTGTIFELFGLQAVTTQGHSIALPAPLSDINAAIALGCLSYLVILSGGVASNGMRGVGAYAQGVFPAHLHELPSLRRPAQRPAGDGAGLLLHRAELCAAGGGGRALHAAPRADPELRADHADLSVLR